MDRSSIVFATKYQRDLAESMADGMGCMGSEISCDPSLAGSAGDGSRAAVAGDRWRTVYRFGVGRSGIGRCRLVDQLGHKRPFWPGRCHGDLVSGALSGLWYLSVGADVGIACGFLSFSVSAAGSKEIKRSCHSLYPLPGSRVSDTYDVFVDSGLKGLSGSFTIEAVFLVPMILGILFLLLQMVVLLHNTVREEAYQYEAVYESEEQDSWRFVQIAGAILEEWEE